MFTSPAQRLFLGLASAMLCVAAASVSAQGPGAPNSVANGSPTQFTALSLRHARVETVQPRVAEILAGCAEPLELLPDVTNNRLLVRGSPQLQTWVSQIVQSLDKPTPGAVNPATMPTAAAPLAVVEPPVVRSYLVAAERAEAIAQELRLQFNAAGIRIAADPRTQQLLVIAPEAVQREIAGKLPPAAGAHDVSLPSVAPLGEPAVPMNANALAQKQIVLRHLSWTDAEARLRMVYGARLTPTVQTDGRPRVRLNLDADEPLDFSFDPTSNRLDLVGPLRKVAAAEKLLAAWDRGTGAPPTQVVPYRRDGEETLRRALSVSHRISAGEKRTPPVGGAAQPVAAQQPGPARPIVPPAVALFQPRSAPAAAGQQPNAAAAPAPTAGVPQKTTAQQLADAKAAAAVAEAAGGLIGPVQIEFLEGLDVLVISGDQRDVDRVMRIIDDIERLSVDTTPTIEVVNLMHVGSEMLADVLNEVYESVLEERQGAVSITALEQPNAVLIVGRADSVAAVQQMIARLDVPVDAAMQFSVHMLRHATATSVQATLTEFFTDRVGIGGKVQVTADSRTNGVIVRGGPRDLAEAAELIKKLDVADTSAENELRVFPLKNSPADELAPIIQGALNSQGVDAGFGGGPGGGAAAAAAAAAASGGGSRSSALNFTTIDSQGHRQLKSGILTEVRITSDPRANALIVSAPPTAMELIGALIRQLDDVPAAEAQIKVFTIINGDATTLMEMLQTLFGQRAGATQGGAFGPQQQQFGQTGLVQLKFSVDRRTNSIIVSGKADELNIVEAILLRLDESDVRQRQSVVYRLKNAPALDVANAINQFLRSEREVQQTSPVTLSPFEQIEKEVVVVPETVSNSLIVSATPRYFEEIRKLVVDIDQRPPMVLIQVLIAEVALNNVDEFGVELGLQDSILFDRSLLGNLVTITNSQQQAVPGGGTITASNQNIVAATNTPGFAFNNAPVGNSGATSALNGARKVGSQGLTNFAVGRTNAELGYGGLVLSASSESVSVLLRALQETRRLDVLSRPQVMTLDNQAAFVQIGSRVPRVTGVTVATTGQTNNVVDVNVGLILGVTPRISPDGLVVMEIDAEKSALGSEADGVPISVSATGEVVRQPVINTTTAQTTVSAMNGQTVVLGGLISKAKSVIHRRVPILSSIPILGNFFRYDNVTSERSELLIIMTPHVVRTDADVARTRQIESARMSWVLGDVKRLHGSAGLENRFDDWADEQTTVIYPDGHAEPVPVPPSADELPNIPLSVPEVPPPPAAPPAPAAPLKPTPPAALPDAAASENSLRLQPTDRTATQVFYGPPPSNVTGANAATPTVAQATMNLPPPPVPRYAVPATLDAAVGTPVGVPQPTSSAMPTVRAVVPPGMQQTTTGTGANGGPIAIDAVPLGGPTTAGGIQ